MNRPVVAGLLAVLGLTIAGPLPLPLPLPPTLDVASAQTPPPAHRELADPFGPRRAVAEVLSEMRGHGGPVRAITTLDDGRRIVTGGFDSTIILWGIAPALAMQVLQFHDSTVNALTALPGGCFASGGEDARIAVWCGEAARPQRVMSGHKAPIAALAVSPDGAVLASGSWDHTIRLWRLADEGAAAASIIEGHSGPVNGLAFLPDGKTVVSAGYDGQVRFSPVAGGGPARSVTLPAPVNAVAASRTGEIVTAGADGHVRFFDARLEAAGAVDLGGGPLTTVALTPDGRIAATAGLRTAVTLVDMATRKPVTEILGPGLPVWSVAFSRDGRVLFTGGADRAVRRWDAATGKPAGNDLAEAEAETSANDPHPGARVFRACKACHGLTANDTNRAGPTLHGIMGRKIAKAPGYSYSAALQRLDIEWSKETIARLFEVGPYAYLPGTKMPEQTISNAEDRKALVEWLEQRTRKTE